MTSRTAFERGREHLEGLEKGNSENALYKHKSDHHLGQEVEFSMKVVRKHYKAISRTIHEAVRINRQSLCSSITSLNSKSEFNVGNLPRLTIPQKETKEGTFPGSKSHGKVFIFRGISDQNFKRKRLNSIEDSGIKQIGSQSTSKNKNRGTLFNYFSK